MFLGLLGFGIICSAVTTVVAEIVSAILAFWWMKKKNREISPSLGDMKLEKRTVLAILKYGGPTALQQAVQPCGKLFIQSAVNSLGVSAIAAFNASSRIDSFALIPEQGIAAAVATFIAQNRGGGKKERVMPGFCAGLALEICYALFIGTVVFFFRDSFVSLFVGGEAAEAVVREGSKYLYVMSFFYIFPSLTNLTQSFFRGCGKMYVTIAATFTQISFRTVFTFLLSSSIGIQGVAFASGIGWAAMLIWEIPYMLLTARRLGFRNGGQR